MDRSYCVYKHTCPNGKVYIGMTGQKPEVRFGRGSGYRNNPHFYQAIQKYGWDQIEHSILQQGLDRETAMAIEKELIANYQSCDHRFGYNMTYGGESGPKLTDYVKKDISDKLKLYYAIPENREKAVRRATGKRHTEETRRKMSESHKNIGDTIRKKLSLSARGRKYPDRIRPPMTEQTKQKISASKKGKHYGGSGRKPKPVLCVETDTIYESITAAGKSIGKECSSIRKCCCGIRNQAHGYHWRYVS